MSIQHFYFKRKLKFKSAHLVNGTFKMLNASSNSIFLDVLKMEKVIFNIYLNASFVIVIKTCNEKKTFLRTLNKEQLSFKFYYKKFELVANKMTFK